MTTNQTNITEPTSPTEVVVGKRDGKTVVAARMDDDDIPWAMQYPDSGFHWIRWPALLEFLTDIRMVDVDEVAAETNRLTGRIAELEAMVTHGMESRARLGARIAELEADKPKPGPWLRGDELEAALPTLKAGDVVEFRGAGTLGEFSGKLTSTDEGDLRLAGWMVRTTRGTVGRRLDALRIIDRAPEPEPGADIPDEVVEAAVEAATREWDSGRSVAYSDALRAALAAADAKRAELDGGKA